MTSSQQRAALQRQIWAIANDVRGSVDAGTSNNMSSALCFTVLSAKTLPYILKPMTIVLITQSLVMRLSLQTSKTTPLKLRVTSSIPANCFPMSQKMLTTTKA